MTSRIISTETKTQQFPCLMKSNSSGAVVHAYDGNDDTFAGTVIVSDDEHPVGMHLNSWVAGAFTRITTPLTVEFLP